MIKDRRNINADLIEVLRLVPKLEHYSVIPRNTVLHQFRSGAKLSYVEGRTWCISGTTDDVNAGITEFLNKVRNGGNRKEDRKVV